MLNSMTFKINIGTKEGKTYKIESEAKNLIEKSLHDKIDGKDIAPELDGYEFEIVGASDKSGFTAMKDVEGIGLKKVLLTYGKAMHKRPKKEGKKKQSNPKPKGLRLRKTVRGKIISDAINQINLKIIKIGAKKLSEIFPDQNKAPEPVVKKEAPKEAPKEESKPESKPETPKEEVKPEASKEEVKEVPKEEKKE